MGGIQFAKPFEYIAHLCAAERWAGIGDPSLNGIAFRACSLGSVNAFKS